MKNKIVISICVINLCALFSTNSSPTSPDSLYGWDSDTTTLLNEIQNADIAGVATFVSLSEFRIEVDVKQWWLGSLSSNRFEIATYTDLASYYNQIDKASTYVWIAESNTGREIVFFAVTNILKLSSSQRPEYFTYDWDYAQSFTNALYPCPPILMPPLNPPMFLIDTNSDKQLHALSNITESVFFTRDRMQFYRGLRDAMGVDVRKNDPYWNMSRYPLRRMVYEEPETNLVIMVNDPLLFPPYRESALNRLIRDFNWSSTNTVPFP